MLRFAPSYKPAPWGARRLEELFERSLPDGPIGESWELCERPEHHSVVVQGAQEGKLLGDLWRSGALGGTARGRFPFLLKWLDTRELLSVQVHPDAAACERMGTGDPKTEAWFVAHREPKARIFVGHYPGLDAMTLQTASAGGTIAKWLYETSPRVGDMLLVNAGTLHAVGEGFVLLEVQQPSDTTYRVYDWDRVGLDGKPRALHLEQAAACIHFERYGPPRIQRERVQGPQFAMQRLAPGATMPADDLRVLAACEDSAVLRSESGTVSLKPGDIVVAERTDGAVSLASGQCLLLSER